MRQSSARATGLIERAVAEAIDAVATPRVRADVIGLALQSARRSVIPERGPAVASFVEGPLFRAIVCLLGEPAATTVRDELAQVAAMVLDEDVSEIRPSWPCAPPDDARSPLATVPAPRGEVPLVVVASSSPIALSMLSVALGGAAYVEPARDALALVEGLGRHEDGLILLDCRSPSVQLETLLALSPELPAGTRVVLWGEPDALEHRLAALGAPMPASWVCCGPNAGADDVAAVCRVLLD